MKFSDSERLITIMLAEIMEELNLNKELDPTLIKALASSGDEWAIKRRYLGIFPDETSSNEIVKETTDMLWMWGLVENSISQLSGSEADEAKRWDGTSFSGFDGDNDAHYTVAQTLVDKLGEFREFEGRVVNSHSATTLPRYRVMYAKFDAYVSAGAASPLDFNALKDLCS